MDSRKSLIGSVFSWSIKDVLNNDLYKGRVKQIPETFSSLAEYLESFINPLIEETRSDLSSSMATLSESMCGEIDFVKPSKDFELPNDLFYTIGLKESKEKKEDDDDDDDDDDDLGKGDLVAITNVRPTCINDLDRPGRPYVIAFVLGIQDHIEGFSLFVQSSKPIRVEDDMGKNKKSEVLFAVKLMNMTTNIRIWSALNSDPKTANMNIIQKVLQTPFTNAENCTLCHAEDKCSAAYSAMKARISSSDLNESQQAAVLSCIGTRECHHHYTVKMIWGPPGTGKTKTVGFLLHSLLKMECRTLTCAPTNTAVLEVTKRLLKGVTESSKYHGYGCGDLVLFGNKKRMKIKNHKELYDIFLDHRVAVLSQCYSQKSGWNYNLLSMISLLEDPKEEYSLYLKEWEEKKLKKDDENADKNNVFSESREINTYGKKIFKDERNKKVWRQIVVPTLKENSKKENNVKGKHNEKQSNRKEKDGNGLSGKKEESEKDKKAENPLTFEEFVKERFNCRGESLYFCIKNLCIHLPTSLISLEVVKKMFEAYDSLKSFKKLLQDVSSEVLKDVNAYSVNEGHNFVKFNAARSKNLHILKSLPSKFPPPYSTENDSMDIREFCLEKACIVFCTVSGSAKLHKVGTMKPFELLVIDEAAQLKECESAIPLQLSGMRHAILIGDEQQLPAMISEEADFGRSLFERLAILGHKKHLLNVQHRMHPLISLFPNREFYDNQILDGQNVKLGNYSRRFLPGKLYGTYSFINVPYGKEEFDNKHSRKNRVEVSVVSEIVASVYEECKLTNKKFRVGVISPYKAQVHAISEKIGKQYNSSDAQSDFSLSIRSVDGFQGGEEDVIIISTVRSNVSGSVGFLSNRQRTNVALTRARYCLWIVGSGMTLVNSGSVWKKLVIDAKERCCFHSAEEDKNLANAIVAALLELNQTNILVNAHALLFRSAKWKVCFTNSFWRSMGRVRDGELFNKVLFLLEKLSSGWRQPQEKKTHLVHCGSSSHFLEHYMVNKQFYLVWAVDFIEESSYYTQVLKVWDVSSLSDIPKLAKQLDIFYGSYTVDKMSRCKHVCNDGNLVVPMRWPVDSSSHEANQFLPKSLGSLRLRDEPETSTTTNR
ncbi:P-loop containing nucleoside triphosphate hydrolase [Trema orientale]|uniref:P-loop containing nucleoside triphosphate hydrolase n=1 Tax=Trema orientale TaxID=63057 RepID=A0A2P5EQ55_TREOI|nr:P-loop containing nucleoside triphosphate hydrolase [Trema orientale]